MGYLNPDCLIWKFNLDTFNFLLIVHSFLIQYRKIKNRFFKISESFLFLYINLKWRAKLQIARLLICNSDWLKFTHFSGYKYKISLVSGLSLLRMAFGFIFYIWRNTLARVNCCAVSTTLLSFTNYPNYIHSFLS